MRSPLRAAALFAGVAGLLAVGEVVWVVVFLGRSSDGPAFVMALVIVVLVPTLLAAIGAVLVTAPPRWTRAAATAAVAASGTLAAGLEAGFFVADEPADPAFIHWVAALPPFAFFVAVLLVGLVVWRLLRPLPLLPRVIVTVVAAVIGPVVVALGLLLGMPFVVLAALAAPVVLVAVDAVTARRRRRQLVG